MITLARWLVGYVVAGAAAVALADPVMVEVKIQQGGEVLAAPKLMVESGIPAIVELDERLHLEVRAVAVNDAADVQLRMLMRRDGVFVPVVSSRVASELGSEASVEVMPDVGEKLTFGVLAHLGDRRSGDVLPRRLAK